MDEYGANLITITDEDGVEYEMEPGDISLCGYGHSHGLLAVEDSVLIVVG